MSHRGSIRRLAFALGLWATCHAGPALAGIHTWDVNEVFSNAAGTIQFVELWEAAGGATEVNVGNGSISSNTQTFGFGQGINRNSVPTRIPTMALVQLVLHLSLSG